MLPEVTNRKLPSFWIFQFGGWLIYVLVIAASMIPFRHQANYVAYRRTSLIAEFLCSFLLYVLCHQLWKRRVALFRALLACMVLSALLGVLCAAVAIWSETQVPKSKTVFRWTYALGDGPGEAFVLIAWSALYFGIQHYRMLEEQRARLVRSEALAREAQLQALRYQLQPHFLFNTLNAISTLVLDNQPRIATQMISKLADLLRSSLDSPDVHQVSLAEELEVTNEYLAIEKIRFGPRLLVNMEIDPETRGVLVPRFFLQPLVENAIRHGVAKRTEGGEVQLRAVMLNGILRLEIRNHCSVEADSDAAHGGLGLANTRTRLKQIYGEAAALETSFDGREWFEVAIRIPQQLQAETAMQMQTVSLS